MPIEHVDDETVDLQPLINPLSDEGATDLTDADELEELKPDAYFHTLSWKNWIKKAMKWILLSALVALVGLLLLSLDGFTDFDIPSYVNVAVSVIMLFLEAVLAYLIYRAYYKWKHEPYYADVDQGELFQYSATNKWLGLYGADPRTINLDTADYLPENPTTWEVWLPFKGFKHSRTVTIDGPGQKDAEFFTDIHDFMYPEKLSAIMQYRKAKAASHAALDLSLQEIQANGTTEMAATLRGMSSQLTEITLLLRSTNELLFTFLNRVPMNRQSESEPPATE